MKAKTTLVSLLFALNLGCSGVSPEGQEGLESESGASIEQPLTHLYRLPLLIDRATAKPWGRLGCASNFECVTNYSESADGSLDAGLYAKYFDQLAIFQATPLSWMPPSNWNSAVAVNFVRFVLYMEPSGATETKKPCVDLHGSGKAGGAFAENIRTLCFDPIGARQYHVYVPPPDGVGWTPQNLSNAELKIMARRMLPEGPRVYLAEIYAEVSYQAP
jgi:hypothetical protein